MGILTICVIAYVIYRIAGDLHTDAQLRKSLRNQGINSYMDCCGQYRDTRTNTKISYKEANDPKRK